MYIVIRNKHWLDKIAFLLIFSEKDDHGTKFIVRFCRPLPKLPSDASIELKIEGENEALQHDWISIPLAIIFTVKCGTLCSFHIELANVLFWVTRININPSNDK